ncbi:uncharacterized protein [Aristolochia californica]|uniref:uncharacterized protein isoform X2 n=1 Tax=Aristolochia californica TaxID=171875 RepID=UPI0035DC74D2
MSRCIPYPPPGYEARKVDKSLIESIKLQRETEKAKKEKRKEKKREKKEKKEKSREDGVKADKNRSSLKRHKEERKQLKNYPDKKYEVVEQLEKSSLTVEYGQPANVGRRLGSSDSDSTQNSSCKRKRADPLCSQDGLELHPKEKKHKHRSRGQMMDAKFRQLFVGWCPPPSEKTLPDCDDEDWLSQRKRACIQEAKRSRVGDDELWRAGPGGPRACFMVEANFYALPYMLPF